MAGDTESSTPGYFSKHKRLVTRDAIEDSFQLHPVDPGSVVMAFPNSSITELPQDAILS